MRCTGRTLGVGIEPGKKMSSDGAGEAGGCDVEASEAEVGHMIHELIELGSLLAPA
jgi:hypothetical protein